MASDSSQAKLNIVFDLNGTLLDHTHTPDSLAKVNSFFTDLKKRVLRPLEPTPVADTLVHPRPHLEELLSWAVEHCNVAVWTFSSRDDNTGSDPVTATKLAQAAFGPLFNRVQLVLDKRTRTPKRRKDLQMLWERLPQWEPKHTIIVDDSPRKFCAHQRHHGILVPSYRYHMQLEDKVLVKLKHVLDELHHKVRRKESPLHSVTEEYLDLHPKRVGKSKKQLKRERKKLQRQLWKLQKKKLKGTTGAALLPQPARAHIPDEEQKKE